MGLVYEAEQLSLKRRVALKVLPFAAALDPKQLQRFQHEAEAAAHLHHTHIVPVYAVGCERGVYFYAMQFIEGQTLAAVIQGLRQLGEPEAGEPAGSAHPASALVVELASGRWAPSRPGTGGTDGAGLDHAPTSAPPNPTQPAAAQSTERSATSPAYFRWLFRSKVRTLGFSGLFAPARLG